MEITKTLLTLGFLLPLISAQLSFFDSRFPPSPATRRIIVRNGQFMGGRSAALLQAPESDQLLNNGSPVTQEHEDSSQELQEPDLDSVQEPIVQQPVPTQRPLRTGNGLGGQSPPLPSRSGNGFSRVPPQQTQQKQQQFDGVGGEEGSDEFVSQRADSALTDISMEDVSTEGITPAVTLSSSEEDTTTEDDFGGPTEAILRAQVTTIGPIAAQRKGPNGSGGRKPSATGIGRKSLVSNGQKPVGGNGRRPPTRPLPKPTKPVAQEVDSNEEEVAEVQKPTAPLRRPTGAVRDRQPVTQVDIDDSEEQTPEEPKPVAPVRRPPGGRGRPAPKPVTQVVDSDDQQISDGQTDEEQRPVAPVRRPPGGRGKPAPVPQEEDSSDGQAVGGDRIEAVGGEGQDSGSDDESGQDSHHSGDPIQWLRDAVRGEPGSDYPIFYEPPETGFKCADQQYPGYYADVEARCQVFHICQENGRSDAFLCPNGTVFSQQHFVCIWWHDFDCSTAPEFYALNAELYTTPESQGPVEAPEGTPESSVPTIPASGPGGRRPSTPVTGPTGGRPSTRPLPPSPVDAIGRGGPEGQPDERIQSGDESTEGQTPDAPQDIDTETPSLPVQTLPDSQEVSDESTEAPADEVITTGPKRGGAAPNGRPKAGIKGGAKAVAKNGSANGKGRNGVTKKTGQPTAPQRTGSNGSAPKPATNGLRKTAKKTNGANGQTSIPSSPADKARNGLQKTRTNGAGNGGQQPTQQKQRTTSGTKSAAGYRTAQRQERDGQSSNWYYLTGL